MSANQAAHPSVVDKLVTIDYYDYDYDENLLRAQCH